MNVTEELLRFAELAARSGLEPGFAGLSGTGLGTPPRSGGEALRVESLSTAGTGTAPWCISTAPWCISTALVARVGA
ncbi:hypothetical protein AB0K93_22740 [Streptomyces sp. NPDC052676]|uniref:hypothetical protein n=1 Tax=Streptomyces sp. NPDC052676 TaxID=3154953 RepID=UPI0034387A1D